MLLWNDQFKTRMYQHGGTNENDPNQWSEWLVKAKQQEMKELPKTSIIVHKRDISPNAYVPDGKMVLSVKKKEVYPPKLSKPVLSFKNIQIRTKIRWCMSLLTYVNKKIRIILGIAEIYDYNVWFQDLSQAHLQTSSSLTMNVYLKPKHRLLLQQYQHLKLLKPLYKLIESFDY